MSDTKKRYRSKEGFVGALLILLISTVGAALLFVNRQFVADQISVWQYQPTSEILGLANRSAMSDTGKFYFYASHPRIEAASAFNNSCGRKEAGTAVLGCFTGRSIYVYDVTNPQLDGMREVTAAHEMLHAAYVRLSGDDKEKINHLLEEEYAKLKDDKEFADRMAFYARTEPGERGNELHSVIGTEVGDVGTALEQYYQRYFTNRSDVVALHSKYAKVFSDLQVQADALSSQLATLEGTIKSQSEAYNTNVNQLSKDIVAFNNRANSNQFTSQKAFEAERQALILRTSQIESERTTINQEIEQYNQLRMELQTVASQSEALTRSIDSSLAPAPSL